MDGLLGSICARARTIAHRGEDNSLLGLRMVSIELTTDLCNAVEKFSSSRALAGGVASVISLLAHTNDDLLEVLGTNSEIEPSPFPIGRQELQSHLTESLLRHGLAQTPWHSDRTGPWGIAPEVLGQTRMDILPRILKDGTVEPVA